MYVFVTVTELTGEGREQDLGWLPDTTALEDAKKLVMSLVETRMDPVAREDPRHFWHNDRIQPNGALLSDLGSGSDIVSLELRPDLYRVAVGGRQLGLVAFNTEETASQFIGETIRNLMAGRHGAACCYEVRAEDGGRLEADRDLLSQEAIPQAHLTLKRRPIYRLWSAGLLVVSAACGLGLGVLSGLLNW